MRGDLFPRQYLATVSRQRGADGARVQTVRIHHPHGLCLSLENQTYCGKAFPNCPNAFGGLWNVLGAWRDGSLLLGPRHNQSQVCLRKGHSWLKSAEAEEKHSGSQVAGWILEQSQTAILLLLCVGGGVCVQFIPCRFDMLYHHFFPLIKMVCLGKQCSVCAGRSENSAEQLL